MKGHDGNNLSFWYTSDVYIRMFTGIITIRDSSLEEIRENSQVHIEVKISIRTTLIDACASVLIIRNIFL